MNKCIPINPTLKRMILFRDETCVLCNHDGSEYPLQIHHRTYERYGNEELRDLCLLCTRCHDFVTNYIRQDRFAKIDYNKLTESMLSEGKITNDRSQIVKGSLQRDSSFIDGKPERWRSIEQIRHRNQKVSGEAQKNRGGLPDDCKVAIHEPFIPKRQRTVVFAGVHAETKPD